MTFSKLKAFLKKAAARTKHDRWDAIAEAIETFTPIECENYRSSRIWSRLIKKDLE